MNADDVWGKPSSGSIPDTSRQTLSEELQKEVEASVANLIASQNVEEESGCE